MVAGTAPVFIVTCSEKLIDVNIKEVDPVAVAFADKTKVVAFVIDAMVVTVVGSVPAPIPVPVIDIPTASEDVEAVVTVVELLVVVQVSVTDVTVAVLPSWYP